jgi:hypothetical protein
MHHWRYTAVVAAALLGACTTYHETTAVVPTTPAPTAEACAYYDFTPGTPEYRICADREREARRVGRASRDYAEARIVADSRAACSYYGLSPGSSRYERCVQREWDARRPL